MELYDKYKISINKYNVISNGQPKRNLLPYHLDTPNFDFYLKLLNSNMGIPS